MSDLIPDEEREVMAQIMIEGIPTTDMKSDAYVLADELIAAGFRRVSPVTREAILGERQRQIAKGYTAAHDQAHGLEHLLVWAEDYLMRGKVLEGAAMVEAARELLIQGYGHDAEIAAAQRFPEPPLTEPEDRQIARQEGFKIGATWARTQPVVSPVTREAVKQMLAENGFTPNGGHPHSWRCEYPDRYPGACRCVDEMTDDIMRLLSVSPPAEVEWEYSRIYYDEGGNRQRRKITEGEFRTHAPDGFRSDGSPYWNYVQEKRVKAGPWVPVDKGAEQ